MTAWQLAYQWAHGRGPSQRHFDENSVMGKEMMQTEYVTTAAQDAMRKMLHLKSPAWGGTARSLGKDKGTVAEILYPVSFIYDVTLGNHTRGLHGSMKVRAEAGMPFQRNGKTYVPLRVTGTDDLSATSGTRRAPSLGGYEKEKGGSLFSKNNPFGMEGPFRTIQANYDLHFSVEVDPRMTVSGAWKIDPSKILPGRPPSS